LRRKVLEFGYQAVNEQTDSDGFRMHTIVVPIKTKDIDRLKKRLLEFRDENATAFESKNADELFCLSVQMFRVSQPLEELREQQNEVPSEARKTAQLN